MERALRSGVVLAFGLLAACAPDMGMVFDGVVDAGVQPDGASLCAGIACRVAQCADGKKTSVSGVVTVPAGTLPLPNVSVYVPRGPLDDMPSGAACNRCDGALSGDPLVQTLSDGSGHFKLDGVPSGEVPLVIQAGKWRRQVTLLQVDPCVDNPVDPDLTRLPRHQGEGHLPKIALTTGEVDALECLLRKVGIEDSEFTPEYSSGRVNLFSVPPGTDRYDPSLNGGVSFTPAPDLWGLLSALKQYDVLVLSCEGEELPTNKPPAALQVMQDYINQGGRVFASHWHNYWVEFGPPPFPSIAVFNHRNDLPDPIIATVDTGFARGEALATWLVGVGASDTFGQLSLRAGKATIESVDQTLAQRWIYVPDQDSVQYLSFKAPVGADEASQCGRMVLTDIHLSRGDVSSTLSPFPTGCVTTDFSPQEMAIVYMFFDLSNCLQPVIG